MSTPCPMPPQAKDKIHERIRMLRVLSKRGKAGERLTLEDIANRVQDIWPGATANHVRGVIAGLASATVGGNRAYTRRKNRQSAPETESA